MKENQRKRTKRYDPSRNATRPVTSEPNPLAMASRALARPSEYPRSGL